MTASKIKESLVLLEKELLEVEETTNALKKQRDLLEQKYVRSRMRSFNGLKPQKAFEKYLKYPKLFGQALYGTLEGKQVFTNRYSLYMMDEPFIISPEIENTKTPPRKFNDKDKEDITRFLNNFRMEFISCTYININLETVILKTIKGFYNIENDLINPDYRTFYADCILEAYKLLGSDIEFVLSLSSHLPLLLGKNKKGKSYILGCRPRN